jgi:Ca2+/H+ antiporter, TMEM165/GDT1 family
VVLSGVGIAAFLVHGLSVMIGHFLGLTLPERPIAFAAAITFLLAELGDKTMLATVALASNHSWAGVWIGATAGIVLANGVAIPVGAVLHKRLPEPLGFGG